MVTRNTRSSRPDRIRRRANAARLAILLVLAQPAAAAAALADDLPAQLLAASRAIPIQPDGRQVCIPLGGLANDLRPTAVLDDGSGSGGGSGGYSASTIGAYLGDGPAGAPAPPFVQALIDAGAAQRVPLRWTQHVRVPTGYPPQLMDTGTVPSAAAPPRPAFEDRELRSGGNAYIVTGPGRDLFGHPRFPWLAPIPPAVAGAAGTAAAGPGSNPGAPPPGLWGSDRICYEIVPDRVLEYGDVIRMGNGFAEVGAAVLFRPARLPAWMSDPRVIEILTPTLRPLDVRMLAFRYDGESWRWMPGAVSRFVGSTHIVGDGTP